MDRERLLQLRRVIEDAPEDRLHMNAFSESAKCGTAYCAAGWAAVDPWFREHTPINRMLEPVDDGLLRWHTPPAEGPDEFPLEMHQFLGRIFGIGGAAAWNLFAMEAGDLEPHAITRAEVLDNIDRLLAGGEAVEYRAMEELEYDLDLDDDLDNLWDDDDLGWDDDGIDVE